MQCHLHSDSITSHDIMLGLEGAGNALVFAVLAPSGSVSGIAVNLCEFGSA